jgi:hypothetical protein
VAVDPNFEIIVRQAQQQLETVGKGIRSEDEQRRWFDFREVGTPVGKFEYEKLHTLFDRSKGNEEYIKMRKDKDAKVGEAQTAKISVDFLAAMERDFRLRHRSRIRLFVHASCRHTSHSQDNGPLRVNTIGWLASFSKEAGGKAENEE